MLLWSFVFDILGQGGHVQELPISSDHSSNATPGAPSSPAHASCPQRLWQLEGFGLGASSFHIQWRSSVAVEFFGSQSHKLTCPVSVLQRPIDTERLFCYIWVVQVQNSKLGTLSCDVGHYRLPSSLVETPKA